MNALITLAMLAYPIYLGYSGADLARPTIYAAVLAVVLFFKGPRAAEVQGNPSKPMMFLMGAVLASGMTAIGYGIGYAFS